MSNSTQLKGVLAVFQTPFNSNESIDFDTLTHEIDWLFERGVDGVVMAMVSEILRLSIQEREAVAAHVCKVVNGRGAVVISVGTESSHTTCRLARHAESCGATALMAIPPVSIALGAEELLKYYQQIFAEVEIPVVVQDASGYVGRPMPIDLQAHILATFGDRVYFKPEAAPLGPNLSALRDATGGQARVFEGSGGIALVDSFRRGVVGTMPGSEIIDGIVELWKALQAGDEPRAYELSLPISSLIATMSSLDGFIAIEKYLLLKRGVFKNDLVRGPVGFRLDDETRAEVDRLFDIIMSRVNID